MNSSRGILIAGNWKMNHGSQETEQFFKELERQLLSERNANLQGLLIDRKLHSCLIPPYLYLQQAVALTSRLPFPIIIAAQNAHWEKSGAFTGEISGQMLQEIGVHWALVGHSERRQYFGETDTTVRQRTEGLLSQGLSVILCVGETQAERESGKTEAVLTRQLQDGLPTTLQSPSAFSNLVLAYEPVWAIGTGLTATPEQVEEAHRMIRKLLEKRLGVEATKSMLILYGGSVTPQNADSLLRCENVDGALVGGASLKVESYLQLLEAGARTILASAG